MKKTLVALFVFTSLLCFAQVPQGISYQAVAFDGSGSPVSNGTVGVQISVLDNSSTGTVVYTETFTKTTNAQGLFNLNIGQGTPTMGDFSAINWGVNTKFAKVEIDPLGGTNYTNVGINQLMSVPYALFAETSNTVVNSPGGNNPTSSGNFLIYGGTQAKVWNAQTQNWNSTSIGATINGAMVSNGSFVIYGGSQAQVWNAQTSNWDATSIGATINGAIASNGSFLIYGGTQAQVWNAQTTNWDATSIGATIVGAVASNTNFLIYGGSQAQVWDFQTSNWNSTSIGATIQNGLSD